MMLRDDRSYRYSEEIDFCNKIFSNFKEVPMSKEIGDHLKDNDWNILLRSDKEEDIKLVSQIRDSLETFVLKSLGESRNKLRHLKTCDDYERARVIFAGLIANNIILYNYLKNTRAAKTIVEELFEILLLHASLYSRPDFYFYPTTLDEMQEDSHSLPAVYLCTKWYMVGTRAEFDSETTKVIAKYEKDLTALTAHRYTPEGEEVGKYNRSVEEYHFCNKAFANFRQILPFTEAGECLKVKNCDLLSQNDKYKVHELLHQIKDSIKILVSNNLDKNEDKIEHFKTCGDYENAKLRFIYLITHNMILYSYLKTLGNVSNLFQTLSNILLIHASLYSGLYLKAPTEIDRNAIKRKDECLRAVYLCIKWYTADVGKDSDSETAKLVKKYEKVLAALTTHRYTLEGEKIEQSDSKNEK